MMECWRCNCYYETYSEMSHHEFEHDEFDHKVRQLNDQTTDPEVLKLETEYQDAIASIQTSVQRRSQ